MPTELGAGTELSFPTCDALNILYTFDEEKDILIDDDETDLVCVVMVFGCGNI